MDIVDILLRILFALLVVIVVMTMAAYTVLAERKVASWIQGRVGPNRTALPGISAIPMIGAQLVRLGIWQPLADGVKLLFKEDPIPGHVKKFYYCIAPAISLVPSLTIVAVLPFGAYWVDGQQFPLVLANVDVGILFILAISSLSVYGIVLAGWSANSKYPYFGSVRSSAQMISYELAMGLSILPVFMWANGPVGNFGDLTLFGVVEAQKELWLGIWMPLPALIFLTALFAETNRLPFDMPESETDLVGGFHTEYSSTKFGAFFVGEYAHVFIASGVISALFMGGYLSPFDGMLGVQEWSPLWQNAWGAGWFLGKTAFWIFVFIWVRWTLPRFKYNQLMDLGWRNLLPISIANMLLVAILTYLIAMY